MSGDKRDKKGNREFEIYIVNKDDDNYIFIS